MSELLLPAGSFEKMDYAFRYGADAVYLGLVDFSLRNMKKGDVITEENLKLAVNRARELNKKVYLTMNIFAFDDDISKMHEKLEIIKDANPHAIILSDFGVYNLIKKNLPNIDIHISTQTNTLNSDAVKFWQDMGASRVILARELSLKQIENIRKNCPDIELETFVHGSQCVSFSGRCLLSDFMTKNERKANHGGCAQPCRWSYKLLEESRPGQYYEICQDNHGSHILSPKDLCLIEHIKELQDVGVSSFKIEGRTKSLYYVSATARAYRMVLDNKISALEGFNELKKVGNRGYTKGFFKGNNNSESYSYDISKGLAGADFLGIIKEKNENGYLTEVKNKILLNDEIECITPNSNYVLKVVEITNEKGDKLSVANTNDILNLKFSFEFDDFDYALLRTVGIIDKREEIIEKPKTLPLKGYARIFKGKIKPDLKLNSALDLTIEKLENMGVRAVLFDIDSTLVKSKTAFITPEVQRLLFDLSKKFKIAMISNNYSEDYINKIQSQTKFQVFGAARKPDTKVLFDALYELNSIPEETVVVGDRPLTDILVGVNAGCKTILVDSISASEEPFLTRFVRKLERLFVSYK